MKGAPKLNQLEPGPGHELEDSAMNPPDIIAISYSDHARTALEERGIAQEWVERTLFEPEETEPDPVHPERMRAFRSIPEHDGRVLRVVYVPSVLGCRVITVFFDRGQRR